MTHFCGAIYNACLWEFSWKYVDIGNRHSFVFVVNIHFYMDPYVDSML